MLRNIYSHGSNRRRCQLHVAGFSMFEVLLSLAVITIGVVLFSKTTVNTSRARKQIDNKTLLHQQGQQNATTIAGSMRTIFDNYLLGQSVADFTNDFEQRDFGEYLGVDLLLVNVTPGGGGTAVALDQAALGGPTVVPEIHQGDRHFAAKTRCNADSPRTDAQGVYFCLKLKRTGTNSLLENAARFPRDVDVTKPVFIEAYYTSLNFTTGNPISLADFSANVNPAQTKGARIFYTIHWFSKDTGAEHGKQDSLRQVFYLNN